MIIVNLTRSYKTDEVTLGMLQVAGVKHPPIFTLENPWKLNKIDISCIPTGMYLCKPYTSSKYPDVYELQKVTDRSKILIHSGNTEKDTSGCILLGLSAGELNSSPAVLNSRGALKLFRSILGKQDFLIDIK